MSKFKTITTAIGEFFLYDLNFYKVQDFFYNLKWFFRNLKNFRKQLWNFRSYDFSFAIDMLVCCLQQLADAIENGHEEERSATKKVAKIRELIDLLQHDIDDDMYNVYRTMKDEDIDSALINKECNKVYHDYCKKIFDIIEGQNTYILSENVNEILQKKYPDKELKDIPHNEWYDEWVKNFDGSGYNGWWD